MRAYININQKAFSELATLKDTKIDLVDATIFEYIYKFAVSNKADKQLIGDKLFIWCSYQKIIDDNPLLNINSKKAIELRLNKLIEIGLFEKFTDKSKGNKTYFNVTDLAYSLVIENTNLSNEDYQPLVKTVTNLSNEDYQPFGKNDYYNSKLNNSQLDSQLDSKLIEKEKSPAPEIISYLNLRAETNYKSTTDKTKSLIKARLNEGFTVEDFKTVIDKKVMLWKNDVKMSAYLRPETLFGNKFEGYLNEIVTNAKIMSANGVLSEKVAKGASAIEEFLND